ncbi:MAG: hypothetical protein ACJ72N_25415 [Labedaea sp.]
MAKDSSGAEVSMWDDIKSVSSGLLIRLGPTITHQQAAIGAHIRWYEAQRPEIFGTEPRSAKKSLDPRAILDPGALFL